MPSVCYHQGWTKSRAMIAYGQVDISRAWRSLRWDEQVGLVFAPPSKLCEHKRVSNIPATVPNEISITTWPSVTPQ
jgi:hypothetical protein